MRSHVHLDGAASAISCECPFGDIAMRRGRRDPDVCAIGDLIDAWTIDSYEPDRRLRLSADMKLPARGWLEFEVTPLDGGGSLIRQTATFDPRGVSGCVYWYAAYPVHALMFGGLLRRIAQRGTRTYGALTDL